MIRVREQHKTIIKLLDEDESFNLDAAEVFRAFSDFDLLSHGQHSMSRSELAKEEFDFHLTPMKQQLSSKVKKHLSNRLLPTLRTVSTSGHGERPQSIAQGEQVLIDLSALFSF
jgi:hypothetical protein